MSLMTFCLNYTCPRCGDVRSDAIKPNIHYCPGSERPGQPANDACPLSSDEHLHVKCVRCEYVWGMEVMHLAPPLTSDEIVALRAVLAQVRE